MIDGFPPKLLHTASAGESDLAVKKVASRPVNRAKGLYSMHGLVNPRHAATTPAHGGAATDPGAARVPRRRRTPSESKTSRAVLRASKTGTGTESQRAAQCGCAAHRRQAGVRGRWPERPDGRQHPHGAISRQGRWPATCRSSFVQKGSTRGECQCQDDRSLAGKKQHLFF